MIRHKRFYRDVSITTSPSSLVGEGARRAGEGYQILLDGRPIRTPAGSTLTLPTRRLAEAVAEEWRAQGETLRRDTMILTKLANTALDRVAGNREAAIAQILAFGKTDLVCYRAAAPEALGERQQAAWDPLLAWLRDGYGAELMLASGVRPIEQSPQCLEALSRAIGRHNAFALAGLQAAAALTGSAIIALALAEGHLDSAQAFAAAHIDETYQAEQWGKDHEADRRLGNKATELGKITHFLQLVTASHLA